MQFDGPCLTAYVWPIVRDGAGTFDYATPGYRDALCRLIGCLIDKTAERVDDKLALHFFNGAIVEVSLKESDRQGPEAAMLQDPTGKRWNVWRYS